VILPRTCLIVAANASQASEIRTLISERCVAGLYPREVEFRVMSDPEHGKVGSGGATVRAAVEARSLLERGDSVLVIHAGGESRRLPTYAPEGKLYAPLPLPSSSPFPPIVLDLQLSLFLRFPWREGEMLVTSGDVVIDFDTDVIPDDRGDVCGFAAAAALDMGSRHGVFKFDRSKLRVVDYYQKESVQYLTEHAALEGSRACAIDLGIIAFSGRGLNALFSACGKTFKDGTTLVQKLDRGELQFDLYAEVLMACLSGITRDQYHSKVAALSRLDSEALDLIQSAFSGIELQGLLTRRTSFLHFGSLPEYPVSSALLASGDARPFYCVDHAEIQSQKLGDVLQTNCVNTFCTAEQGARNIYMECCTGTVVASAGGMNLIVGLENRTLSQPVPSGICLDERALPSGRFLLVYGIGDTWTTKSAVSQIAYCGTGIDSWLSERGLAPKDIFPEEELARSWYDLWSARLFLAEGDEDFTAGYWNAKSAGHAWRTAFLQKERFSLREITAMDSVVRREGRRSANRKDILREEILQGRGWTAIAENDFCDLFTRDDLPTLRTFIDSSDDDLSRIYRGKLVSALESARVDSIGSMRIEYLRPDSARLPLTRCVKQDQIVWARCAVRLDLAGGWTDTPPFTLREGGEVVNLAVNLNDQPPIQVFCRPTEERAIRIHSIDLGVTENLTEFEHLEDFNNPRSPFALPKAALCLLGLTREGRNTAALRDALERIGCGLELSLLSAVPKGSGLGTSSILGATILGALERFFGLSVGRDELIRQVLQMEQMLTTGGGWQDQIGGLAGGVKYIVTRPGLRPDPVLYQLDPFLFENAASCFTLYYTGVTRLAKGILQDVVDGANSMEPAYLFTLRNLKRLARGARESISRRDIAGLAATLNASWDANKLIHPSTTNDEIEELLGRVTGLYAGMKLLGAGGGGFALFLSESAESANRLKNELGKIHHERARLVEMNINHRGLQVTVS
jgi:galactokinase/mevalonate kinase-like predicted kinase